MGSVYARHNVLWLKYRDPREKDRTKQIKRVPTEFKVGEEEDAKDLLRQVEDRIAAGLQLGEDATGPTTVRSYGKKWIERRRSLGLSTPDGDEGGSASTSTR